MLKHNLGYPRIGIQRELKKACEAYWYNKIDSNKLFEIGKKIRKENWKIQEKSGLDLIPCNDFSFYDHVLDMSLLLGCIPDPYLSIPIINEKIDLYFSMARGFQKNGWDVKAMEMTKWFNTNYHYIVPEFHKNQKFHIFSNKIFDEFEEIKKEIKSIPKPVLIGPITYLFLGKEKENSFHRMDLIENLIPVYIQIIKKLKNQGSTWIQIDEPILVLDLSQKEIEAFQYAYQEISKLCSEVNILLTSYFDGILENISLIKDISIQALHIDVIEDPGQLEFILDFLMEKKMILSLGLINGRNIWKNNYVHSIKKIERSIELLGDKRVMIAPNSSLLHIPIDIEYEYSIPNDIKEIICFAKQKIYELSDLENILKGNKDILLKNFDLLEKAKTSSFIHDTKIKERVRKIKENDIKRKSSFKIRQKKQHEKFNFPFFPTTTIGSFPQTKEIRILRSKLRKKELSKKEYENKIQELIVEVIRKQEEINLDVLVHGEFERNDMVEFFSEKLKGFISTDNGWVQSYGSRCVKPPVIYGDVGRIGEMTVDWICFAQSKTKKLMKGMLTGPVTILQWSFVRDDQPISTTAYQIALAIRDEVKSLEDSGIRIIQIDEPALREGLPLKKKDWTSYFNWSIKAFRIASSGVKDETQIHTHMCYSEFNDILKPISDLDADVITIETSRSKMELLKGFSEFSYPNEIGPGVYDIHSPRIPTVEEILDLIKKASNKIPIRNIWINPDCGLKTRKWNEVIKSLKNMTEAAKIARKKMDQLI
ncbi:MAG: 5-methyltetrahydropteroyltriglutamate--homocysteine S-methyltransferase [Flavobacteriales bacterium]|jgi:5-methyltetrahydropteroyltriglutamate--homocysteine methyltransferase|uniref:5-methyltetrahydropteroyltriglutamate-- homocysteine S-methyltransferase n=1 Tax=Blattabacterium sp. (Mastotermes darwiniensis) TaxID=39768 RepID=UPI000231DEDF|nr:5-methyltetrahydropteroyltriglutamate--homocysteine S-methyltransferase [Blattabacterium sp. (Mastotermes darwiniensis)]AER40787.1 5-methyltetrahydropteroyltriglutamate--homocysteine [Blattabacterium sp. (Mastotermes darwiniensis) str. MADAR]MDR1804632.1 5-methyltetrahydropteroyltriglutamate--homocysteine S-methyltransferase [Flavobacteriales bacterium]